jgi:nodulation protein E
MERRVVITGCGFVSALGVGREPLFDAFRKGVSGVRALNDEFEGVIMKEAAPVKGYVAEEHFSSPKKLMQLDEFSQFALVAAREAIAQSELDTDDPAVQNDTGVVVGSVAGGIQTVETNFVINRDRRVHPMAIPKLMASAPSSQIAMEFGFHGPSFGAASACSSAAHAIGQAVLMIRSGLIKRCISGGTENTHLRSYYRAWDAIRVCSRDKCRPFSKDRSGIVIGEGAGIFVLEEYEAAKERGANILAEIVGVGMTSDAADLVAPDPDWVAQAIKNCLDDGGITPGDVGYINAHGTGTQMNDACESKAIKEVFGDTVNNVMVSSTKPIHGHALGAAAGLEIASVILALNEGVIAPTLNYNEKDPECDLNYVVNEPKLANVECALSNSFAFGGLNAVLAFRQFKN